MGHRPEDGIIYDKQCHKCLSFNVIVPVIVSYMGNDDWKSGMPCGREEYECLDCGTEWVIEE